MAEQRERRGIRKDESAPQLLVPIGTSFQRIRRRSLQEINRKAIVFMGHLREHQGTELIIDALPEIIREVPDAKLIIVGKGPMESALKERTKRAGLEKHVEFLGFMENHVEIENVLATCAVGVAPYAPSPYSYTLYTDPAKPKTYMACGLPVIITKVPRIAYEIETYKAGIVISYSKEEFVKATVTLLTDDELYGEYRKNAIMFASKYEWNDIFHRTLASMKLGIARELETDSIDKM